MISWFLRELRDWIRAAVWFVFLAILLEGAGFLLGAFVDGFCRAAPSC